MKIIVRLFIFLCIFSCNKNSTKKNSLLKENILGEVQIISEYEYSAIEKFGEIQKDNLYYSSIQKYDNNGNVIESNFHYPQANIDNKHIYKYDEKGNVIERNIYKSNGSLDIKNIFKYDEKGNQIEINTYKNDGNLQSKYFYKYDKKGNQIENITYKPDGSIDSKNLYKYDEKGNQIEGKSYKVDGTLINNNTYKYDEKGNQIEWVIFKSEGSNFENKYTHKYDGRGNQIENCSYKSNGELAYKFTYKYDQFDKKGNWLKKVDYIDGSPSKITIREIEYYGSKKDLLKSTQNIPNETNNPCDTKFIGDWVVISGHNFLDYFEILNDGSNIILVGNNRQHGSSEQKFALACEKGKLLLKGMPMMENAEFSLINDGSNILFAGQSYEKLSKRSDYYIGNFAGDNRFNSSVTITKDNNNIFHSSFNKGTLSTNSSIYEGEYSLAKDGCLYSTDGTGKKYSCDDGIALHHIWSTNYDMYTLDWVKSK